MGAGAGAGFGAAGFLGAAAFFGAATRAFAFLADFFATARFAFLRAGAAFFALLPFLVFDFAFFAFLAIINSRRCGSDFGTYSTLYSHLATTVSPAAAVTFFPASACGAHPPVAQSISSTLWTTGSAVPAAICAMQPIFPAAITSGLIFSIF